VVSTWSERLKLNLMRALVDNIMSDTIARRHEYQQAHDAKERPLVYAGVAFLAIGLTVLAASLLDYRTSQVGLTILIVSALGVFVVCFKTLKDARALRSQFVDVLRTNARHEYKKAYNGIVWWTTPCNIALDLVLALVVVSSLQIYHLQIVAILGIVGVAAAVWVSFVRLILMSLRHLSKAYLAGEDITKTHVSGLKATL
jgi:hypothetical protein